MPSHAQVHRAQMQQVLGNAAVQWADRVGRSIANRAKQYCPVDEGHLRSSITHTVTVVGNRVTIAVGSPLPYARWRHEGTGLYGPHRQRIVPVTAKALKFRAGRSIGPLPAGARHPAKNRRQFVFARSVAGIPGSPFLTQALEAEFGPAIRRNPTT